MGLPSLSNLRQYRKQGRRRKSKEEKRKRCVRYTLLIANSLLALLGLLLLAGGAWRTQSRRPPLTSTSTMPFWPWAITLLVALFGYCGAKKENQCLLSLYSICVFIILLLQIAAIVFINIDDANIDFIKNSISKEAGKIDIDVEKLQPGSKFVQNLFFGVSAGLSAIILFFTVTLCCRARREERVQGYVDAIQA